MGSMIPRGRSRSPHNRVTRIVVTATGLLLLLLFPSGYPLVLRGFRRIEIRNAEHDLHRFRNAMDKQRKTLSIINQDWAVWDAAHAFVQDTNTIFIAENLVDGTFETLQIHFMVFADATGGVVYAGGSGLEGPIASSRLTTLLEQMAAIRDNPQDAPEEAAMDGILRLGNEPMLISLHPILTSKAHGPPKGVLAMGRYMDTAWADAIREMTMVQAELIPWTEDHLPPSIRAKLEHVDAKPGDAVTIGHGDAAKAYAVVQDLNGKPILAICATSDGVMTRLGRTTLLSLLPVVLPAILLTGGVLLVMTKRLEAALSASEQRVQRSREDLRRLHAHLDDSRDEQNKHLSRWIHDDLGQLLALLRIDIDWLLEPGRSLPSVLDERIQNCGKTVDALCQKITEMASQLHPPLLDVFGISAALEDVAEKIQKHSELHFHFDLAEINLPESVRTPIFEVLRELMFNATRHAQATTLRVRSFREDDMLVFVVTDDGCGMPPSPLSAYAGFGLNQCVERLRAIHAHLAIQSKTGHGTTISVRIPMSSNRSGIAK